jgi:hypothetical protein
VLRFCQHATHCFFFPPFVCAFCQRNLFFLSFYLILLLSFILSNISYNSVLSFHSIHIFSSFLLLFRVFVCCVVKTKGSPSLSAAQGKVRLSLF